MTYWFVIKRTKGILMTYPVNISNEIMGGLLNIGDVSNDQLYQKKERKEKEKYQSGAEG